MLNKPTLLIDGDLILYRSSAVCEKEVRWDDENHVLWANEEEAWEVVERELRKITERFKATQDSCVIALTKGPNFRLQVDPTYKSNRVKTRKPICYSAVKERLEGAWRCVSFPGLEADDVMGIFATRDTNSIICSMDKDMRTIPCTLFDGKEVVKVSEAEADYFHLMQTLMGDTTDGYPGCPGIGPKKAEQILYIPDDKRDGLKLDGQRRLRWEQIVKAFEKAGLTEADALTQARLARILRSSDWDHTKKEPILWTP